MPMPMPIVIRLALPADHSRIDALRRSAYASATWFQVHNASALDLACDPPHTRVLVATPEDDPDTLLATVAVARSETADALDSALGAQVPRDQLSLPTLSILRLAAAQGQQGGALNHVMRLWFLRAAMASDAACFCSSQAKGTPNLEGMQRLGYTYQEVPSLRQRTVHISEPTLWLNWLPRGRFNTTLAHVHRLLDSKAIKHRWCGEPLDLGPPPGLPAVAPQPPHSTRPGSESPPSEASDGVYAERF